VSPDPVRVLVLYSHPLMGEGLGRMLAAEAGVSVDAVDITVPEAVEAALAREPEVVIVEEGGALDAVDIVRRSKATVVLDVDITTTRAWTLRREILSTRPDDFLATVRSVVGGVACLRGRGEAATEPAFDGDRGLQPAAIPG
jgi:hypothetical protein